MKEFIGNIWQEREERGVIRLGFSRRFIEDRLSECFHVMQADSQYVRKGGPLMVIETNDGLESLKSPLSGSILVFNAKARNFPDRLLEDDVIMEVLPEGTKLAATKKETVTFTNPNPAWINQGGVQQWWQDAQVQQRPMDELFAEFGQPQPVPQAVEETAGEAFNRMMQERQRIEQAQREVRAAFERRAGFAPRGRRPR